MIYGDKQAPVAIHVEEKALIRHLGTGHFMNSIVMVEIDGASVRTLPKDVALHPVNDRPLHVYFLRLAKDAKVEVLVPVVFVNQELSPGLKKGGVLNVVRHELDLICEADRIPAEISLDVTGLEVGDSIHISHVTLPEGSVSALVWERGAGETRASGSSAIAVGAAAVAREWCTSPVRVAMPGGELLSHLADERVVVLR